MKRFRKRLTFRYKPYRERVDAVSSVRFGETLADKDMPQMAVTISTLDFYSMTISIRYTLHRIGVIRIERGPAAVSIKLALG